MHSLARLPIASPLSALLMLGTLATWSACKKPSKAAARDDAASANPTLAAVEDAAPRQLDAALALVLPTAPALTETPLGLPRAPFPEYNPTSADKVALGKLLFFDPRLSGGSLACATCHDPAHGWSSPEALTKNASGQLNQRHTPSLWNLAYHEEFYWDGRAEPLEAQILGHWRGQMGSVPAEVCERLAGIPRYAAHFQRSFDGEINRDRAAEALAAFVRNLLYGNSAWDRFEAGDANAVSAQVIAGSKVFNERAGCATCHMPPLYTDLRYHRIEALGRADAGRALVSNLTSDEGAFKTPSLRGVRFTAPFFHDGSAATLDQLLDRLEASGSPVLSPEERAALLAFMDALSPAPEPFSPPKIP